MIIKILLIFTLSLGIFSQFAYAEDSRNLDELIQNDREERILKINQQSAELNQSLIKLESFNKELKRAQAEGQKNQGSKVVVRNATAALAAVALISTLLFQSKGISPGNVYLGGGYSISALAAVISYLEHRAIHFTKEEIIKLSASVAGLEKLVKIEKANLAIEIRLLCLEDGGSPEACSLN